MQVASKQKAKRGFVEGGRSVGHSRRDPMVARRPKGPGRPAADDPRVRSYSFRVKKAYEKALEQLAKDERRTAPELMRIIVGDYLISKGLLPEDYDF